MAQLQPIDTTAVGPIPESSTTIEAINLCKSYNVRGKPVHALQGVSFSVCEGTVFGLLGPNGAGKTTLTKILTTLSRADAGHATVAGVDVAREPEQVRRLIGYVPQRPSFDPVLTGRENLVLQGRIFGLSNPELRRRCDELLERFDLMDAANRQTGQWSGGMQRKLDIALALIHRPRVIFLDEPTTGLDPAARATLWEEIAQLVRTFGITVMLTTHYLDEADRLADELLIIDQGRVVTSGRPDELKDELGGDVVHVEFASADEDGYARHALEAVPGVNEVWTESRHLRARVTSGPRTLPAILTALANVGNEIVSIAAARPSLDAVYLHHTGKAYRATEMAAPEGAVR